MADACRAVKNAKLKYGKTKQIQHVHFRSRKNLHQVFGFDKASLNKTFVFARSKDRIDFYATEELEKELEGTRIIREDYRWYVIVPETRCCKKPENQRFRAVALDPGVRTFIAMFSPEMMGKIGENDFKHIFRLCLHLDKLISKIAKAKCQQKRRLRKAAARLRFRIKSLIDDLHRKTASWLVRCFDRIFIPPFETSNMVKKLRSKTARSMLTFAHYRFKQFLKAKAEEYNSDVIEVSEAYTSKTCSFCGRMHNIGSKKRLVCSCGMQIDRDLNGARGIFLRAMLATTSPGLNAQACIC